MATHSDGRFQGHSVLAADGRRPGARWDHHNRRPCRRPWAVADGSFPEPMVLSGQKRHHGRMTQARGDGGRTPFSARAAWRDLTDHPRHGPLPAFLLVLTMVSGVVDAVSVLRLGRVFVANMTGNVAVLGFALGRAPGFSLQASASALLGFVVGAAAWGAVAGRWDVHRGVLFRNAMIVESGLFAVAVSVAVIAGESPGSLARSVLAAILAVAMGLQNAVVPRLAVPGLTTTVMTRTLAGIASDAAAGRGGIVPRAAAVLMLTAGALLGTLLSLRVSMRSALLLALTLLLLAGDRVRPLDRQQAAGPRGRAGGGDG